MNHHWQTLAAGLTVVIFLCLLLWYSPPVDEYTPDCLLWQSGATSGIKATDIGFDNTAPLSRSESVALNQSRRQYSVSAADSWKEHSWLIDYHSWLEVPCNNSYWRIHDQGKSRVFVRFPDNPPPRRVGPETEFWITEGLVLDTEKKAIIGLAIRDVFTGTYKVVYSE